MGYMGESAMSTEQPDPLARLRDAVQAHQQAVKDTQEIAAKVVAATQSKEQKNV